MTKNSLPASQNSKKASIRKFSLKEVLVSILVLSLLFFLLPLEYDNIKAKTFLYPIIWTSFAFIMYKTFPVKSLMRTILFSIGAIIYVVFALSFIINLTGFCAWINHGTLYVNKRNPSVRIISRGYGCFLTDDDGQLFEERRFTPHIKWVTDFSETPIDTTKWKAVPFMSELDGK
jgi:hypothetical protein